MECPEPRVALGLALRGVATAAIDLSDGLIGDLRQLLKCSAVGAEIDWAAMPCSALLTRQTEALRRLCLLAGGDDYELLFTAPPAARPRVAEAAAGAGVAVHCIGRIVAAEAGLRLNDAQGHPLPLDDLQGFDHFHA